MFDRPAGKDGYIVVTDETASSGQLGDLQRNLIRNVFDLDERAAEELMTSRSRIEALDIDTPPEEVTARVTASCRAQPLPGDRRIPRPRRRGAPHQGLRPRPTARRITHLRELMRPIPTMDGAASAEQLLERFRRPTRPHPRSTRPGRARRHPRARHHGRRHRRRDGRRRPRSPASASVPTRPPTEAPTDGNDHH
ncbi:MAG: hypothetical protein ACFCVK_19565 [Acidimicrobiales bacterium]